MPDLDDLAERAVNTVTLLVRKGSKLAMGVLLFALLSAALCILIAAEGLAGSARSVALAIATGMSIVAVGTAFLVLWRLRRIGAHSRQLVGELRTLIDRDEDARRTVIETVEVQQPTGNASVIVWSRQYDTLRRGTASFGEFRNLNAALLAISSFPVLVVVSVLTSLALGFLSLIFAIGAVL